MHWHKKHECSSRSSPRPSSRRTTHGIKRTGSNSKLTESCSLYIRNLSTSQSPSSDNSVLIVSTAILSTSIRTCSMPTQTLLVALNCEHFMLLLLHPPRNSICLSLMIAIQIPCSRKTLSPPNMHAHSFWDGRHIPSPELSLPTIHASPSPSRS